MIAAGVLLGVGCRFVPEAYQAPCSVVTKVLVAMLGGS